MNGVANENWRIEMVKIIKKRGHKYFLALVCACAMILSVFGSNIQYAKAASNVEVEIDGFQISAVVEGYRTVYSVIDTDNQVSSSGLVYGLADCATQSEMVVGSSNEYVYDYQSTKDGALETTFNSNSSAKSYAMTMKFFKMVEFYNQEIYVRAYARLKDGSYVYSDCAKLTVFKVAKLIYNNILMSNHTGHEYLYNNILTVVDPNFPKVDYTWSNEVVAPGDANGPTTEAPTTTQAPTTEAPTQASGFVTANANWTDLQYWSVYFASGWAGDPTGAYRDGGSYNDFGVRIDKASGVDWGIQMKTQSLTVTAGKNYVAKVVATANKASNQIRFKEEMTQTESWQAVVAGTNTFTLQFTATSSAQLFFDLGQATQGLQLDITSLVIEEVAEATTTVKPTTKPQTTTAPPAGGDDVIVDTSISKPIGVVVSCPEDNTIAVVWGFSEPNSFVIYIDGVKKASKAPAAYYTYYGYLAGTHTVSVATYVDGRESERVTMTVDVYGTSNVEELTTRREISYDNSQNDYGEPLPAIPNIAPREDRMYFKMNNRTNGKYADNQIYWCILGKNEAGVLCYVDANANLVPASTAMNTIKKGDRMCADISFTLEEADYLYMPDIDSGRMYLSYGDQVYLSFNIAGDGMVGYAGPDLNNPGDPNQNTLFEYMEFTITNKEYWGNTTRVDFYSFPAATRLIGDGGWNNYPGDADHYDRTVGDLGKRDEIFQKYRNEMNDTFDSLITDLRIMAPCKTTFNEGQIYGNYMQPYIDEFWSKYSTQDLVFKCDGGKFTGRVYGDYMQFTKENDSGVYYVYKPTTQDILEGKGNLARGNATEKVIQAQLCAAFNRGVATDPDNFGNEEAFYKHPYSNFYCKFWHENSIDGLAYGFCYDDVFDYSTLLHYTNPTGLIIDLKW